MVVRKGTQRSPVNVEREMRDPLGLLLDEHNPRLVNVISGPQSQDDLLLAVWNFGVLEIVTSILASGFHNVEPLFAEKQSGGDLVVIEGNRRLCALQVLLNPERAHRLGITGLESPTPEILATCRSIPVAIGRREDVWAFVGTKHLNGPKTWDSAAKANYIKHVHERFKVPLDEIAAAIGDRSRTVVRMYESVKMFDQAEAWGEYRRSDSSRKQNDTPFSHLYTIVGYESVRAHLNLTEVSNSSAPVPPGSKKNLGELLRWLYGDKARAQDPLVISQNPDLRNLAKAIGDPRGLEALRAGSSAASACERAEGDEAYVESHLRKAHEELEQVARKFATGYTGQPRIVDLLFKVREVVRSLSVLRTLKDQKDDLG